MRSITLLAALLLIAHFAHAQDKIYKADGSVINAKVKTVGTNTVTYKKYDNPTGPDYTILKKEISSIVYETGGQDNFKQDDDKSTKYGRKRINYGKNIFCVIPGAYSASLDGTINDAAIGISYERQLDKFGHISFYMPVLLNFTSNKDFRDYDDSYNSTGTATNFPSYHSYTFMPGVKFYPATTKEKVRYSLGAAFFATFGKEPYSVYDYNNYYSTGTYVAPGNGDYNYALYGVMISNSVNVSVTKNIFMSIDLSTGFPVSDNRHAGTNEIDELVSPFIQFAFKAGYRF